MKHPHCNRSHAAHLFWCRGFAPVVFIFAIALIVVAIGTGVYFSTKQAPQIPDSQAVVPTTTEQAVVDLASSTVVTISNTTAPSVPSVQPTATISAPGNSAVSAVAIPKKPTAVSSMYDCGSDQATVQQCLAGRLRTCSPARGVATDANTGLSVERIVDGYMGEKCSYRSNIISGKEDFALLVGMDINCMLPKSVLAGMPQDGSMSSDDMFTYCTGSFIELMQEQRSSAGIQ